MGRQIINSIVCSKCGRQFDIATEDIEWNHLCDLGSNDADSSVKDYGILQTIQCPFCHAKQKIAFSAQGKDATTITEMKVFSVEI